MAQIVLVLTAQQTQRIATDVGGILGLGRDATAQEVHDWWWAIGKAQCMNYERMVAHQVLADPTDLGAAT